MSILRLILGDQLNSQHSWFQAKRSEVTYVMMEMRQETDYVKHHVQKLIGYFAAMRCFVQDLQKQGHQVIYLKLNDKDNKQQLDKNLAALIEKHKITKLEYLLPDEYRLDQQLWQFCQATSIDTEAFDTEHFYTTRTELAQFFQGKKQRRMENFYRHMRQKHQVLMEQGQPLGRQWNFDQENRKKWQGQVPFPASSLFQHDCSGILTEITQAGVSHFGEAKAHAFPWPITRKQALKALDFFVKEALPYFGTYQDAMTTRSWHLFHARLSLALNTKLLSPQEVVAYAIAHWQAHQGYITIAQVEGFVRQIIGWREFMRGIYWEYMPGYASKNALQHQRRLPGYYWTGKTKMRCMHYAIGQSLEHAYAHHIQRLMVTGNFALLAGIHPDEVDEWYLGIYIDAIQWVEITNTRGMSQFADGGIVATKPYASSANYIHKMSDYCHGCYYDYKKRHGERACPFNSLYWHFLDRHRALLNQRGRMRFPYNTLDKMSHDERVATLQQADQYLADLAEL